MSAAIHRCTPHVTSHDPRGLAVKAVDYLRTPTDQNTVTLITRQVHDVAGRLVASRDHQRRDDASPPNLASVYSLSGQILELDSIDSGWRLNLPGPGGEILQRWDARQYHWCMTYDEQLRLLVMEESTGSDTERYTYANGLIDAAYNLRGQMRELHDTSGKLTFDSFSLLGSPLDQTRLFADARPHRSRQTIGPMGQVLIQIDAANHVQDLRYDVAGQLKQVFLQQNGTDQAQTVLHETRFNAAGRIIEQRDGNNVVRRWDYDPANDRLTKARAGLPGEPLFQDLEYSYDNVGNVLQIIDHTFKPKHFANQYIDGQRDFTYDSLYRLLSATGHDSLPTPDLPGRPQPSEPDQLRNYTQRYTYDPVGNLIMLVHEREVGGYTRKMRVAPASNRALRWQDDEPDPDFERFFDAHGNQRKLQHGADLLWNARDQLNQVTTLTHRNGLQDDRETYLYSQGERVSKQWEAHTPRTAHFHQVRYLPDLEIHTCDNGEELHVISLPGNVRCLHWHACLPVDIDNNQLRYNLTDHLGSSTIELDQLARLISQESYYPFGETAIWLPRSKSAVDYKTLRYSGKEMDASGLYYYGARYYAPWLQRWISADPAGHVDGLNLYGFVGNNPLRYIDDSGFEKSEAEKRKEIEALRKNIKAGYKIVDREDQLLAHLFYPEDRHAQITKSTVSTIVTGAVKTGAGLVGGIAGGVAGTFLLPGAGTTAFAVAGAFAAKEAASQGMKRLAKKTDMETSITPKAKNISWQKAREKNLAILSVDYASSKFTENNPLSSEGQKPLLKLVVKKAASKLIVFGAAELMELKLIADEAQDGEDGLSPMKLKGLDDALVKLEKDAEKDYQAVMGLYDAENIVIYKPAGLRSKEKHITAQSITQEWTDFRALIHKARGRIANYKVHKGQASIS
ncbi:RHS repeat domain-containing protein [Pseudomonas atagonensis]|uniref:RHS repeat domain-containing protein n=1 Tax=Pseudomonas atagonensis TaxID=2609964 RepID=UPI0014073444|nr:RHS repeat-associated core domain-containing protein [Pseudomonas atagonensis]